MHKERLSVILSFLGFMQLMFIGFGGSFAVEVVKDKSSENVIFLSSLATLILAIIITCLYVEAYSMTRREKQV